MQFKQFGKREGSFNNILQHIYRECFLKIRISVFKYYLVLTKAIRYFLSVFYIMDIMENCISLRNGVF